MLWLAAVERCDGVMLVQSICKNLKHDTIVEVTRRPAVADPRVGRGLPKIFTSMSKRHSKLLTLSRFVMALITAQIAEW